jgi:RNA polymerase sigma factor (sigma-70 family)
MAQNNHNPIHPTSARFLTTQWSRVLNARDKHCPQSDQALADLCERYWFPLYAFVRHQGHDSHQSMDLTQGFFARLLEKHWLDSIDHQKGRFRNFLMAAMKHYVSDERAKSKALKRGGGKCIRSLNQDTAETRYQIDPADPSTPEQFFERQWALALLEQVLTVLQEDYAQKGKADIFECLKQCLSGQRHSLDYTALAHQLETSEGNVRILVHRLKTDYRSTLRDCIAETVSSPEEIDQELQDIKAILLGRNN